MTLCIVSNYIMSKYSISIIIPVYKAQDYIGRCLDSVMSQSCEDCTLECILVNDFTPDRSMEIVTDKIKKYNGDVKFKVLNHTGNKGASAARNTGIGVSEGNYILFVDSDDYLERGALQAFIKELDKVERARSVDVVVGNTYVCKDDFLTMKNERDDRLWVDNTKREALRMLLSRDIIHLVCNKLIRRDFLLTNHLYFEEGIIDEDLLWSYLVFSQIKSALLLTQVTYVYCDNPQSVTNTPEGKVLKIIKSRVAICERISLQSSFAKDMIEYYVYIFYILMKAVDLYEKHRIAAVDMKYRIDQLRKAFLKDVWRKGYFLAFISFLPLLKPYYYITFCGWYRRYFDKISKLTISLSHAFGR